MTRPAIDHERFGADFEALRQFGLQPDGAIHRVAYGAADRAARRWLKERLTGLGLSLTDDAAGNTLALYPGHEARPPIGVGSHTDSVPMGGAYDGALGDVAALALIEALHSAGEQLRHPLALINLMMKQSLRQLGRR